jgi:hypothetical protein
MINDVVRLDSIRMLLRKVPKPVSTDGPIDTSAIEIEVSIQDQRVRE